MQRMLLNAFAKLRLVRKGPLWPLDNMQKMSQKDAKSVTNPYQRSCNWHATINALCNIL
ncbi:unnamed protein product, partial [Sphenostylis stenocarpa]